MEKKNYLAVVKTEYMPCCYETTAIELCEQPTQEAVEQLEKVNKKKDIANCNSELADRLLYCEMQYYKWLSMSIKIYELV
jgi:NTP pyrophosphatase (non-canonical NTP hydrolase)